jgi:UDP-glucose 4-epimerase
MDSRDLNYEQCFDEGNRQEINYEDYHLHNTQQLRIEEVDKLLLTLPEVRAKLYGWAA